MRTVNAKCGSVIPLGRLGENEATVVVFDIAEWLNYFGDGGSFSLLNVRDGETAAYPCAVDRVGNEVRWEIKSADVANVGYGKCELIYTIDNTVAKSEVFTTVVGKALTGGGEVPEPWEDWVEMVLQAGADAQDAKYVWENMTAVGVESSEVFAEYENGVLTVGVPMGGGGGTYDHTRLDNLDAPDQHPISAVIGLQSALDGKQPIGDYATTQDVSDLADIVDTKADSSDIPSLDGYATEQWVENQGYLTEHQSLDGYATEDYVNNHIVWATPEQYGAVGDGTKNDTDAFISAFESGYPIKCESGKTYRVSGFNIDYPIDIDGNGCKILFDGITAASPDTDTIWLEVNNTSKVFIRNVNLEKRTHTIAGLKFKNVDDLRIENVSVDGKAWTNGVMDESGTARGVELDHVTNFSVINSTFKNFAGKGISVTDSSHGLIDGNVVEWCGRGGIYYEYGDSELVISNNKVLHTVQHFESSAADSAIDNYGSGTSYNISVVNNYIEYFGGSGSGIASGSGIRIQNIDGAIIRGNKIVCSDANAYTLMQIYNRSGKPPCRNIEIDGNQFIALQYAPNGGMLRTQITAGNIKITNNLFDKGEGAYTPNNYCINCTHGIDGFIVSNNKFNNLTGVAVNMQTSDANAHKNAIISNNLIIGRIVVKGTSTAKATGIAIVNNTIKTTVSTEYAIDWRTNVEQSILANNYITSPRTTSTGISNDNALVYNNYYNGDLVGATYSKPTNGIPASDLASGVIPSVPTSLSQLSEDSTHRVVTDAEKSTWNGKQNAITDLETIRSGASKGATAVQPESGKGLFSGNYNDLTNKPTIPSAVTESTVSGWGFTKNTGTYSKPSGGIPKTDLASAVQTSLGKADTALQSVPSTYALKSDLPTKTSELTNDSGYLTLATLPVYNGGVS